MNLPELPEGYFWRIKYSHERDLPIVELRKRGWLFSRCVKYAYAVSSDRGSSAEDYIESTARAIFRWWQRYDTLLGVEGDYHS